MDCNAELDNRRGKGAVFVVRSISSIGAIKGNKGGVRFDIPQSNNPQNIAPLALQLRTSPNHSTTDAALW
jgi:hypothetical protein